MLNENIKALRKSKGLSQQELAVKLNVVRQTVSKWEQGLSVPDSDTEEDVGLLIYDYCANGHEYSGGISNADRSLLKRNEELIVVWNQQALNNPSDTVDLSIQFRIITEYVDPNYENIYPEEITQYLDSVSWDAHLGESYFITITGDQTNGYTAALTQ